MIEDAAGLAGMDEAYNAGEPQAKPEEGEQETQSVDEEAAESPTALLPKTILAGKTFKEGDEVVLKIVGFHGDEVEVEYAPEKPEEGAEDQPEEVSAGQELDEIDQNDKKGY